MNGALYGGYYTIENRYVFLVKQMLLVCKPQLEQGHQFALALKDCKPPLIKVQKGALEIVNQPWTSLSKF